MVSEIGFGNPSTSCVPKKWPHISIKALVFLSCIRSLLPSSFPTPTFSSPVFGSYMQDPFCMLNPGGIWGLQEFGYLDTFSMTTLSSSLRVYEFLSGGSWGIIFSGLALSSMACKHRSTFTTATVYKIGIICLGSN